VTHSRTIATVALTLLPMSVFWPHDSVAQNRPADGRDLRLASVARLPASPKRYALIIGVDEYDDEGIQPLRGAANDARRLAEALVRYAGFPESQVFLLTTGGRERPTRGAILRRLSNLRGAIPEDGLLLLAFSGHGIERGGKGYLLASDAQSLNDVALLEDTAISTDRVRQLVKATGVRQVILLVDACRNDPEAGKGGADNVLTESFSRAFNFDVRNREVEAFVTLYAAAVGERAYEDRARSQGYFSEAVVEGLSGLAANHNGEVTLDSLVRYVTATVAKRTTLQFGAAKQQRPFSVVEGYRASDLVISVAGKGGTIASAPPPPPQRTAPSQPSGGPRPTPEAGSHPLDGSIPVLTGKSYWAFSSEPIDIRGKFFSDYGVMSPGPDGPASVTFDVRGWKQFTGTAGTVGSDVRSTVLTVLVDGDEVGRYEISHNRSAALSVDLQGHETLTLARSGRYPLIHIGTPRLTR
jgi:hypothetical protein